jgi:hypothetical protein
MGIGGKARSAEATVGRVVDNLVERLVGSSPRQPLEIVHAVLEDIERQVQPAGRGRWIFPFNRLTLELLTTSRESKAQLAAVIGGAEGLRARIAERLQPTCALGPLDIRIRYRTARPAGWNGTDSHLELERVDPTAAAEAVPAQRVPSLELTVSSGGCERRRFAFAAERIDIGRGAEVIDSRQRLLRRNQVAFTEDGGDANQTVSRRHAHIVYQAVSREYRVYDDNSSRGTNIVRNGTTIPVPSGARGVGLQSGDELLVGQARLRVRIG